MKNTRAALRTYRRKIQLLKGQIAEANKIIAESYDQAWRESGPNSVLNRLIVVLGTQIDCENNIKKEK